MPPESTTHIVIALKRFLLVQQRPAEWRGFDLYLFRDKSVVFYVGQSQLAFARVWEHLIGGFKGHSMMGRFVWTNWPRSMNFMIELMDSRAAQFSAFGNDVSAAEKSLIQQYAPCFNIALNDQPTPPPAGYRPANAPLRCGRSLNKLVREAERATNMEDQQRWLRENMRTD